MNPNTNGTSNTSKRAFLPAKPAPWFIRTVQECIRADLALTNSLYLDDQDLEAFRKLPADCGVILTSNHADEMDPRVCLEISRRVARRFIFMCNREAFDENLGLAGRALQRLGYFSVERGGRDQEAKSFAVDVVKQGQGVLVIFPEGEIYYLNENVRPFHSGAIDICMQAIVANRKINPNWTAYIVPMGIKYHYRHDIQKTLEKRMANMEAALKLPPGRGSLQTRLIAVQTTLLRREEQEEHIDLAKQQLTQEINATKKAILAEVADRHQDMPLSEQARTIDQAWQLSAQIRKSMSEQSESINRVKLQQDLDALKQVAHLSSWLPKYYSQSSSQDRLAEGILKVERDLFKVKRPSQLGKRSVLVRLADPIDMGPVISDYIVDAHAVRRRVTDQLHEHIQSLVDTLTSQCENL